MTDATPQKTCRKCGTVKAVGEFNRNAKMADGLATWCKTCRSHDRAQKSYAIAVTEKSCTKCGQIKTSGQFKTDKNCKDGLSSWCRECHKEMARLRQHEVDTTIAEKVCTECGQVKPVGDFSRNKRNKSGLQSTCKTCQQEKYKDWYAQNADYARARTRQWVADNQDKVRAAARYYQRKIKYGLTADEYDNMLALQSESCAACGESFEATPHVDHDHSTGEVRGLLCGPCNTALGMAQDSEERLLGLVRYLKRHNEVRNVA